MTTFGEIIDVDSTITSAYKDSDESLTKDELLSIAFDRVRLSLLTTHAICWWMTIS